MPNNFFGNYPFGGSGGGGGGGGSGVTSLDDLTGAVNLAGGTAITTTVNGQTITISYTGSGSGTSAVQLFTLNSMNIANKYVSLATTPGAGTNVMLFVAGGPNQFYGVDFTVSGSAVSWSGLGLDGILSVGDMLTISYF